MASAAFTTWQVRDDDGRRKYVNQAERERFLREADRLNAPERALCYTLALTGCRISEALGLCRHQLDTEQLVLTFRTLKRRRLVFRDVPIPADLAAMLLSRQRRHVEQDDRAVERQLRHQSGFGAERTLQPAMVEAIQCRRQ